MWLLLGPRMTEWLELLKPQIIVDVALFTLVGLALGYTQVKAMAGLYRYLAPDVKFVDRRTLMAVYAVASICWLLYCFAQYSGGVGNDESKKNLVQAAHFSTLAGLGFSVMFVIWFLVESIAYIRSRSRS